MKWMFPLLMLLTFNVLATEVKVCEITSNIDNEKTDFFIEVVDGKVDSVRLYRTEGTRVLSDDTFPAEKVIDDGIVAVRREGRDAVILRARKFDVSKGGIVVVDHLYNGITNSRAEHPIKLLNEKDVWVLRDMDGKLINRMFFHGHRKLGRTVGIQFVSTSFQK
jgi:hypothetical protein